MSNRPGQVPSKGWKPQLCPVILRAHSDRDDGARDCPGWVPEVRQGLVTHGGVQGDRGRIEASSPFKGNGERKEAAKGKEPKAVHRECDCAKC